MGKKTMAFLLQETIMHEIIWHGRGGQGVVVAAQILAESAYWQGYKGVTSAPTFGPERRGAPLTASTRISDDPLRTFSQIEFADIAVVLDPSLLKVVDIQSSLKEGGLIIINTNLQPGDFHLRTGLRIAVVDAVKVALNFHLLKEGAPVVNTPLLGAFARAAGLVSLEAIENGLKKKLPAKVVAVNSQALKAAYEQTIIGE
jgi:2-oxoacid:acceptor oxidoreductase gamma subunit (pyruvate/2-ketoisovalerate family)